MSRHGQAVGPGKAIVTAHKHALSTRVQTAGVLAAAFSALALGGCGSGAGASSTITLDSVHVERAIATSILRERGLEATVTCPASVPQQVHHVFTCQAHLNVGTYPVTVTETNGDGHVRYENQTPLEVLDIAHVQKAIETSILEQRRLRSRVTCPREVLQQAGLAFTCQALVDGSSYPFAVTELDNSGHVRYAAQ
jgi:hypothetical protein